MSEPQGKINSSVGNGPDFETTGVTDISPESVEAAKGEAAKTYHTKSEQVR